MLTSPLPDIANTCVELATWGVIGAPVPPPPIVKQITLGCYVRGSRHRRFVETGTYLGHTTSLIASLGVEIDTIELSEMLHGYNLKDFADVPNVRCHQGDSTNVLPGILKTLDTPAVFWLDGHYSAGNTAHGNKVTPIVEELELLREHDIRNHVVLIDDMRGFGANGYPSVEWVMEIGRQIVPDAEPRLFNDSLILATAEQHAAAEAQRPAVTRQFLLNEAAPISDLPGPAPEVLGCAVTDPIVPAIDPTSNEDAQQDGGYKTYAKDQDWTIYYLDAEPGARDAFVHIKDAMGVWFKTSDFSTVLDFACGYGRVAQFFAPFSKKIIFSDIRQDAVDMCKKRYDIYRSAGITHMLGKCDYEYIRNSEKNIPLDDGSVSFIFSWDSLIHLETFELKPVLQEFGRILKPGGRGAIHHSNVAAHGFKQKIWHQNHGSRAWMTADDVDGYLREAGLTPAGRTLHDRSVKGLDAITLFEKVDA